MAPSNWRRSWASFLCKPGCLSKIAATEACQEVLLHASQAHGARGFLAEEFIGRLYADARALTIGGGASEALIEALSRIVLPRAL